jgi:oligoendopeptidase F
MSATLPSSAEGVRWDLSDLFAGMDDPRIAQTWESVEAMADAFEASYRGQIETPNLAAPLLAEALKQYERIYNEMSKPIGFAHLLFAANTGDAAIGAFLQAQRERSTALSVKLLFFELELQAAPADAIEAALADSVLANYRHFVRAARAYAPYRLSEPEEIILEETANTGARAWDRLFDETLNNHEFTVDIPDEGRVTKSLPEVTDLLRDADRARRQAGADALSDGLKSLQRLLVFTYNTLLQDKAVSDRLRGYTYPEQGRHLSNELDKETVDLVMRLCREHYEQVARFYRVKREILGLPELTHIDRYAPLFAAEREVEWSEARRMVESSFGSFSPEMERRAAEFFDRQWIDAEPRKSKQGGAFCAYNTPDTHPVILQSYLGRLDDVMTLAHELGHGVHASLSRDQSLLNFHGTLPLAELASTFGEMLVFERLTAEATPRDRLALYAQKIEGVFATIFRQAAMFRFEQRAHESRRSEGELSAERFGDMWQEEIQAMFGDSVQIGEQHRVWWSYIPHFIGTPFYVYAYSFGELLVLSLYQMAKTGGPEFAERYIDVLRLGGSETPQELMGRLGIDLKDEAFWRGGFTVLDSMLAQFEGQWAELGSASLGTAPASPDGH